MEEGPEEGLNPTQLAWDAPAAGIPMNIIYTTTVLTSLVSENIG
jgi:hypothetical protein